MQRTAMPRWAPWSWPRLARRGGARDKATGGGADDAVGATEAPGGTACVGSARGGSARVGGRPGESSAGGRKSVAGVVQGRAWACDTMKPGTAWEMTVVNRKRTLSSGLGMGGEFSNACTQHVRNDASRLATGTCAERHRMYALAPCLLVGAKLGLIGPKSTIGDRMLAASWPRLAELGQLWSQLAKRWRTLASFGPNRRPWVLPGYRLTSESW